MLLFSFLYSYPALRPFFSSYGKEGLRERVICLVSFLYDYVFCIFKGTENKWAYIWYGKNASTTKIQHLSVDSRFFSYKYYFNEISSINLWNTTTSVLKISRLSRI